MPDPEPHQPDPEPHQPDPEPPQEEPGPPQVSVVLICFNDRERLPDAIESARQQSLHDIEIIIVDHGSTDGSLAVAQAAAVADPRIRVLDLGDNHGKPGRPINAGIRSAIAPWVTVFASDDVLRTGACESMLCAATDFNADIVVGSLQRVNMDTGEAARWMPGVTSRTRVITSIAQLPELVRDTTGGGKLYNVDFIRRHDLSFPEDIYYQDQVFTLEYYATARTVAILSTFVLEWRHWPEGRQSVTQRRTTLENLSDRLSANARIDAFLRREDRKDLLALTQQKFLRHDLSIHVKDLSQADPQYRQLLVESTNSAVAEFLPDAFVGLPLNKFLMLNCIRADRLDDAETVTSIPYNRIASTWERVATDGRDYVIPPWHQREPDPVFDVTDYRLPAVPARFAANRVEVLTTVTRTAITFTLSLTAPGRTGGHEPRTADLVLGDTSQGNRLTVGLKRAGAGVWRGTVSVRELDSAFGENPGDVDLMTLFDDGTEGRWSSQVHTSPDQAERGSLPPWTVTRDDDSTLLQRESGIPTPRRFPRRGAATRSDARFGEVLTLAEAKDYLKSSELDPRLDRFFFESFAGRRIADGPLEVSRRLRRRRRFKPRQPRQFWSCTPWAQLDVPSYAVPAPRFSVKYLDALAESAVWFDNGWLPFRPTGGRRLVQLWHGTPIMRLPVEESRQPPWHSVASSGPYFESCLTAAWPAKSFTFIPSGAARTDPLLAPEATKRRARLRESWGLADRTVVFFGPALRSGGVAETYRQPDLHTLAQALGSDYFWLHREHDNDATVRRMPSIPDDLRWFAASVSGRVEVSDHLLMADILVTDYSDVLADFALTERPIIRFITDSDYVEQVNPGTYLTAAQVAAGPVVADEAALAEQIRAATHNCDSLDPALTRQLCPLDAQRSADALLDWLEL